MNALEFDRLVQKYQSLVYTICRQLVADEGYAQDLTQETFLSAYKKLPEFDGTYEKAWISRIATNKCLDYLKNAARRSEPKEDIYFEDIKDQRAGPEEIYIDQEAKQFVLKICGQIKPPYDKIAREHFYEEKSAREIAEESGKNLKTVQTQIYRAKALIKKQMEGGSSK